MDKLNLKYNACKIDLRVAGQDSYGSGFLYVTSPSSNYNYVITAKHILSEDSTVKPQPADIADISIMVATEGNFIPLDVYSENLEENLFFHPNWDVAIIRVRKIYLPRLVKVWMKNFSEINQESLLRCHACPNFGRDYSIPFDLNYHPDDEYLVRCNGEIKNIHHYHGISGGGVYLVDEPYMVSVISKYPFVDFEMNRLMLAQVDWDEINEMLYERRWQKLERGASPSTRIAQDRTIIDLRDISINRTRLNLDTALRHLHRDMIDDWFFDPLQYVDLCNRDFVLDYFSNQDIRAHYKFQEMEVFYLPKESLVQRKAMVGNFVDRLLYIAIVEKLAPLMEKYISSHVYAARLNLSEDDSLIANGVNQWIKMNYLIDEWLDKGEGCLFKCDVVNYFDNISHATLIGFLREISTDANALNAITLLEQMLSEITGSKIGCGLPQNSDASSLLATFYLSHVDAQIQAQATEYCRFMDDIYFMAPDYFSARNVLQSLEGELRRLNLCLNSSKVICVKVENKDEVNEFRKELSLYNHTNQKIKQLIRSEDLGRRENGIALLINTLHEIMNSLKRNSKENAKDIQRKKKFLLYILCNYPITLMLYWDYFYSNMLFFLDNLKIAPVDTPLICRLISCVKHDRDLDDAKRMIANMLMREKCDIYPWQAYHFWLLMAHLKYDDEQLIKYAAVELERNDTTRRIENAAIIIYLCSVCPAYVRVIINMLGKQRFHGYMQTRAALIACRSLNPEAVASLLPTNLKSLALMPVFLHRNKEKELTLMGQVSSYLFKSQNKNLYTDMYSGL